MHPVGLDHSTMQHGASQVRREFDSLQHPMATCSLSQWNFVMRQRAETSGSDDQQCLQTIHDIRHKISKDAEPKL